MNREHMSYRYSEQEIKCWGLDESPCYFCGKPVTSYVGMPPHERPTGIIVDWEYTCDECYEPRATMAALGS